MINFLQWNLKNFQGKHQGTFKACSKIKNGPNRQLGHYNKEGLARPQNYVNLSTKEASGAIWEFR